MDQSKKSRIGVFHNVASARRAISEARENGFQRIHLVSEDPAVADQLGPELAYTRNLDARSPGKSAGIFGLVGAAVGLVLGFLGAWLATTRGIHGGITNIVLPLAGALFGGFVGLMLSRGATSESDDFYDQEVGPDDILIAIEDESPFRLEIAERILRRTADTRPIPLPVT